MAVFCLLLRNGWLSTRHSMATANTGYVRKRCSLSRQNGTVNASHASRKQTGKNRYKRQHQGCLPNGLWNCAIRTRTLHRVAERFFRLYCLWPHEYIPCTVGLVWFHQFPQSLPFKFTIGKMAKSIWVQSYCKTIRYKIPSARHFTSQQFGISAYLTCSKQLQRGEIPPNLQDFTPIGLEFILCKTTGLFRSLQREQETKCKTLKYRR